jgi:hypothetical protein
VKQPLPVLAVTGLLALTLSACGGGSDGSASGDLGSYCSLVKAQKAVVIPAAPKMDPKNLDLGVMRTWLDKAVAPLPERTARIVAVAPDSVVDDWRGIQGIQQGLADDLDAFLQPTNIATWEALPLKQRLVQFATKVLKPLTDLDKAAPGRINAEVLSDCHVDLGLGS